MNKNITEKILYSEEYEIINIINLFENDIQQFLGDVFVMLKGNKYICHLNKENYINNDYNDKEFDIAKNAITNNIPLFLLLGGSSYKIYSKFLNDYYNDTVINYNDDLIDSLDYDVSIMVNKNFDNNAFKNIMSNEININTKNLFNKINNSELLEIINKNDVKKDIFLSSKKIANMDELNKILFTYSTGSEYNSVQLSIKFKNKLYQIVEFLLWKNKILTVNISLNVLKNNKCVLYQNNNFKFLLPNLTILIKTNILSM